MLVVDDESSSEHAPAAETEAEHEILIPSQVEVQALFNLARVGDVRPSVGSRNTTSGGEPPPRWERDVSSVRLSVEAANGAA